MMKFFIPLLISTVFLISGCSDLNLNIKDNSTNTENNSNNENIDTGENQGGNTGETINPDDNQDGNSEETTNPDDNQGGNSEETINPDDNQDGNNGETTNPDDNQDDTEIPNKEQPAYDTSFDYGKSPFDSAMYYGRSLLQTESEKQAYDYIINGILNYDINNQNNMTTNRLYFNLYDNGILVTYEQLLKIYKYINSDDPRIPLLVTVSAPKGGDRGYTQPATVGTYVKDFYVDARFLGNLSVTYTKYRENIEKIEVEVSRILNLLKNDMSEAQKFRILHDEFVSLVSYGMQSYMGSGGTIESTFIPNSSGYYPAVCQGYAKGLQYLSYRAGLPAIYVVGVATYSDRVDHAWIMVKIDNQWYNTDPTNDDPPTGSTVPVRYTDFLQSDSDFNHDHTAGISTNPSTDASSYGSFPQSALSSYPLDATNYN